MKIIADVNVSRKLVERLRAEGIDIVMRRSLCSSIPRPALASVAGPLGHVATAYLQPRNGQVSAAGLPD